VQGDRRERAERFVDSGLDALLGRLLERGCARDDLEVKAAGGATLLLGPDRRFYRSIASRNLEALRATLARLGLGIARADLGGRVARSVELDTRTGALRVSCVRAGTALL
jgi:chemotaxis receptor (MCP) glutamine deamidase CheD